LHGLQEFVVDEGGELDPVGMERGIGDGFEKG